MIISPNYLQQQHIREKQGSKQISLRIVHFYVRDGDKLLSILVLNPDMFQEILPKSNQYERVQLSSLRLVHMFESGYSPEFMQEINSQKQWMKTHLTNTIFNESNEMKQWFGSLDQELSTQQMVLGLVLEIFLNFNILWNANNIVQDFTKGY
eukprot:403360121